MPTTARSTPLRYRLYVPALVFCALAPSVRASDPAVMVDVRPTVSYEGGDVRTTIRTPRDTRNRELRIVLDSGDYYASSDVQLDGDDAPATHQFTWKSLPGGAYRVEAILMREGGDEQAVSRCFAVLGRADRPEPGTASSRVPPQAVGILAGGC